MPPRTIGPAIASSSSGRPRVEVLLHRRAHLAQGSRQQRLQRFPVEGRSLRRADCDRFAMAGKEALAPLRRRLHRAGRRSGGRRRQRERAEERELLPQHGRLVEPDLDLEPGRSQLVGDLVAARPGSEVDTGERRRLADEARLDPLRLDAEGAGKHALVALPEARHVVDAVQERHDDGRPDALRRGERERRFEIGRLRRDPEHVDLTVELRGDLDVGLEVAEHGALHADPARVARERLRPEQEDDVVACPCQGAAQQAPIPPAPRIACRTRRS